MAERLIVIGGDAAGMSAAAQARRRRHDLEIVALEKGSYTSTSACGIPYLVSGDVADLDDLVARTPQQFRAEHRIDVRMRHEVLNIDLASRRVTVRDHAHNRDLQIGFDLLHVATGARPTRPDLPGIDAAYVHGVQTLDDAAHLLGHARQSRSAKVAVIGGGYIGLEMAEAFTKWGAEVVVVDGGEHVMRTFDPDVAERIEQAMTRHGIDLRTGVDVQGFEEGQVLTSAGPIATDLVLLGIGVTPNTELAAEAGLELGAKGALRVDRRQRTSCEGVWAAGDCAESFHLVTRQPTHIALGTVANRQGRVAGINIGGGYATFPGVVGTAVSKVCATEVGRTGLTSAEAEAAGFAFVSTTIEATDRAGYFPGARPMTVKMLAEVGSGRVIGCQIIAEDGASKRIDVIATAITAGMTVDEVIDLDLAYAPPVGTTWDPLQIAARQLRSELAR
jgi:NADPH-dependent 2,4-dienoyl-CoA reductase/sulfur reductase-like enzyme